MAIYKLIKDGNTVNTIIADEVDSIRHLYDSIEEVIVEQPIPMPLPAVALVSLEKIRNNLTLHEKVKWDNNLSPNIVTAKLEFAQPLNVEAATSVLQFLVDSDDILQESMNKILQ